MNKKIAILCSVALLAVLLWVSARPWIESPSFSLSEYGRWLAPLVLLLVLSASAVMAFLLLEPMSMKLSASALIGLPFLVIFGFSWLFAGAFALILLYHWRAAKAVTDEAKSRITLKPQTIVSVGLAAVITPLLIALSFAYYQSPAVQASAARKQLPAGIEKAIAGAAKQAAAIELRELPASERPRVERELVNQVLAQINGWVKPYIRYLPPILAFGLFLFLQGFGFAFRWLAGYIALGIFWLFKKTAFVKITEKDVKAQVVSL